MKIKNKIESIKVRLFDYKKDLKSQLLDWASKHALGIFIFNLILVFFVLLHNAGYFHPFFPITINIIVFTSLLLAVFLLGLRSRGIFFISLWFILFAQLLLYLRVEVWADRTMIYAFQSYFLGVLFLFFERPANMEDK